MIYNNADEWNAASNRRVLFFGMSGVGKTHISSILRGTDNWFHYSIDYRIGTRYMCEHIVDNFKREAMSNPFLAQLLKSDSIYIASNITFGNLAPLSTYLGKPGNAERGGIPFEEYKRRQRLHRAAEIMALRDTAGFIDRSTDIYRYPHFVCDSSGSICEVVDPEGGDELLAELSRHVLLVWIRGGPEFTARLIERYQKSPKPMYYREEFLDRHWDEYLSLNGLDESSVDPDEFSRWIHAKALEARQPRYEALAMQWGISIDANDVVSSQSAEECCQLIARALELRDSATVPATGER